MKFLGEFIQHFISRFRNDVFLEDVSTGTIASGGNLGLDSNNKIVKAASSVDLASEATGTLPVANGGTGAASLTNNAILLGNGTGAIEASSHLSYLQLSACIDGLVIGDGSTAGVVITTDNAAPLNLTVEANSGTNAAGGDLTLAAGTSTGNAAGGDIIFRSSPTAGGSGTSVNVPAEIAVLDNTGNLQIDGNLTPAGFVLDGNTITGIDDSSEFTDNDAHIMTSAAINDRFAQINADTTGQAATVATIAGLAPNTATTAAAQPNITSLGTLTAGLSIGGASYTGAGVSVTGSPSDNTYDVFIGKRKYPRITLIDDAASGDTAFQIWNLGDELRIGTSAGSHGAAALVIHAGNAALVEVQDDLLVNDDLTVSGQIELGHASDTTIARSAAGTVTIEGNPIQTTNVHHHFLNAGFFLNFPYSRYIPLNGSITEQNTATLSPEYVNFTWPYDGFVKTMWFRSETDMGSTNLKLYKGAAGAEVTTALGNVTATVGATATVEFDFTSVTNTYSQGDTMAILCRSNRRS